MDESGGDGCGRGDDRPGASVLEGPREAREDRSRAGRGRRVFVDRDPHRFEVAGVVRGAESRHREVLFGICALSLNLGFASCVHQGRVPADRALEAQEAPVVAVRCGELDCLVEEGRVDEEMAGDVDGVVNDN